MKPIETATLLATLAAALFYAPFGADTPAPLALAVAAGVLAIVRLARNAYRWQMIPAYLVVLCVLAMLAFDVRPDGAAGWVWAASALAACGLAALLAAGFPLVSLPAPDGPFAVGAVSTEMTRESAGTAAEARNLRVKVWYPATSNGDGGSAPESLWAEFYAPSVPLLLRLSLGYLREIGTHTFPGASFSASAGECPVILYNHGLVSIGSENTLLMEMLASRGYIAVSISHAEQMKEYRRVQSEISAEEKARDKARFVELRRADLDRAERSRLMMELYRESTGMPIIVRKRAEDTAFVLDNLDAVLERIPGHSEATNAAACRVGAIGFSLGGAVATEWCKGDMRCDAAVNIDGGLFGDRLREPVKVPYLMLYGESSAGANDFLKEVSGAVFEETVAAGASHLDFNDGTVLWRLLKWVRVLGRTPGEDLVRFRNDRICAFLDTHLKGGRRARQAGVRTIVSISRPSAAAGSSQRPVCTGDV